MVYTPQQWLMMSTPTECRASGNLLWRGQTFPTKWQEGGGRWATNDTMATEQLIFFGVTSEAGQEMVHKELSSFRSNGPLTFDSNEDEYL